MGWLFASSSLAAAASSPSTPSNAASSSPVSSSSSEAPLEQRLIRVTKEDISRVTPDDIRRVRATLTDAELSRAIRIVLDTNRFADVLIASSAATWAEAATGVTEVQMGLMGNVVRDRMGLLYNMLPYVSDEFLTTMGGSCSDVQCD
jgi:hypothetical protein